MVKKITMMQQHSTEQRSTVASRRCLTNFNICQSVNVSSLETVCMLTEVLKVSSGTCQQFVEDAVKISNVFGFSAFTR